MNVTRILCPVDFSEAGAAAARYAVQWARHHDARLTLLHVAPPMDLGFAMAEPAARSVAEFAEHRNETARHALNLFPGDPKLDYPVDRILALGGPAEEIVRLSNTNGASEGYDLIIMPTHGAGAIRRWMLVGSVTTKVLHATRCPVLAATDFNGRTDSHHFGHVVCALDLNGQSRHVLCAAAGLARQSGASLTVVHAVPDLREAAGEAAADSLRSRVVETARGLLEEIRAEATIAVEAGSPEKVVREIAARGDAGLIVIGRGASHGVLGRLRAHSYEIIRHAPCPVLSL